MNALRTFGLPFLASCKHCQLESALSLQMRAVSCLSMPHTSKLCFIGAADISVFGLQHLLEVSPFLTLFGCCNSSRSDPKMVWSDVKHALGQRSPAGIREGVDVSAGPGRAWNLRQAYKFVNARSCSISMARLKLEVHIFEGWHHHWRT